MIFLLDTDTLIFMIRGLKSSRQLARKQAESILDNCRDAQTKNHSIGLSAITVSELEFCAQKSGNYSTEIAAVRKVLAPFDVYDFDTTLCPMHYGKIRYDLESKGVPIGSMDLLIAAQALSLDATLVTNNRKHFGRVSGLNIASWMQTP